MYYYYYGRRDRKTWQPFGAYIRSSVFASRHWFVSCPGVAAELSIKPAGPV